MDGCYIGVIRTFEGGVSESRTAAAWLAVSAKTATSVRGCTWTADATLKSLDL